MKKNIGTSVCINLIISRFSVFRLIYKTLILFIKIFIQSLDIEGKYDKINTTNMSQK